MKKLLAIPCLILVFALISFAISIQAEELVILHTNDLHGQSLSQIATMVAEEKC